MCILSFKLSAQIAPHHPNKLRLGDEIGIYIILKISNGNIHKFFDCLVISLLYSISLTEMPKNMKYDIPLKHFLPCSAFCLMPKKAKTSFL